MRRSGKEEQLSMLRECVVYWYSSVNLARFCMKITVYEGGVSRRTISADIKYRTASTAAPSNAF